PRTGRPHHLFPPSTRVAGRGLALGTVPRSVPAPRPDPPRKDRERGSLTLRLHPGAPITRAANWPGVAQPAAVAGFGRGVRIAVETASRRWDFLFLPARNLVGELWRARWGQS